MKKVVNGFIAFLLLSVSLGNIISNTEVYLKANETLTNEEKTSLDTVDTVENSDESLEENNKTETSSNTENSTTTQKETDESNKAKKEVTSRALITLSGDATYESGNIRTSDQLLADAKINLLGIRLNAGLDMSAVNFGVPGTYTTTALGLNTLGIAVAEIIVRVHIVDTTAPVITGNTSISFPIDTTITNEIFISALNIKVTDNASAVVSPKVDLSKVKFDKSGKYDVVVTAKDASGNNAIPFTISVTIGDVIPPVITGNTVITYTKGITRTPEQFLTDIHAVVTDNSGEIITPTVELNSVNFNRVGTYFVKVHAKDTSNNHASPLTVTISIVAVPANLITAKADVYYEAGTNITTPQLMLDANIKLLNIIGLSSDPLLDLGTVDGKKVGVYPITATAVSLLGINLASVTINIHIVDKKVPTITGNNTISYPLNTTVTNETFITNTNIKVSDNTSETIVPTVDLSKVKFNVTGTYTATVTAKDSSGNQSVPFNISVIIGDVVPPVITGDRVITYTKGISRTQAEFLIDIHAVVTDNSGENIIPTVDLSSVNFNQVGSYTVNITAKDSSGNTTITGSITIHIVDTEAPTITGNTNISYEIGSTVIIEQFLLDANIVITDNSGETITPVVDLSGVDFNTVGIYVVDVVAIDSEGNIRTFPVTIEISDNIAPIIDITSTDVTYEIGTVLTPGKLIIDANITVIDNSGMTIIPRLDLTTVNTSQVGDYVVIINADDGNGNVSTKNITIHIVDTVGPTITGDSSINYEIGTIITPEQFMLDTNINVTDNSGAIIVPTVDLSTVDFNTPGIYVVEVIATDGQGNSVIFEVSIVILDRIAPVIEITNANLTYEVGTILTNEKVITDANITVTDNSNELILPTFDLSLVNINQVGDYVVVINAEDSNGNVAVSGNVTIHIVDTVAPTITGNQNVSYEIGTNISLEQFILDANIEVIDNSGVTIIPIIDLSVVDFNTPGTYVVVVSATDSQENTTTFNVSITVEDTIIPIIDITTTDLTYEVGTLLTENLIIIDANITVSDNSGITITPIVDLSTVDVNQVGTYTASVTAADNSGNLAVAGRVTIYIVDTTAPIITGTSNMSYEFGTIKTPEAFLIDANIGVTDNSGAIITPTVDLSPIDFNTPGTYIVEVIAVDNQGNSTSFEITVEIIDSIIPNIDVTTADLTYELGTSLNETQIITDANITVSDNSGEIIVPILDLSGVNTNIVGTYIITVAAADTSNNQANTAFITIHIVDTTAPVIAGTSSIVYPIGTIVDNAQFILDANITVTDNSGELINPLIDLSVVDFNTVGNYIAIVTAIDISGNNQTFEVNVEIKDDTAPTIDITTTDLTYEVGTSLTASQIIIDANITATDNGGGIITPQLDLSLLNTNQVGTYTITVTATDATNNEATATITIYIIDTTAPVIAGTTNLEYEVGSVVTATQFITDANIVVTDNSGEVTTPVVDLSGVDFNTIGTYVVTVIATDSQGNSTNFEITVEIKDSMVPVIDITITDLTYEIGTVLTAAQIIADGNITVTDNSGTIITPQLDLSSLNASQVGTYTIEVTATDTTNNEATATITIHIVDTIAPVVTGSTSLEYEVGATVNEAQIIFDAGIVVTDNSGETIVPIVDLSGVDFSTVGSYVVVVTAADLQGNSTIIEITIEIKDSTLPIINITTGELTYEIGVVLTTNQIIADANIVVTDNSGTAITPVFDISAINTNQLGTYTLVVTAIDINGNQATEGIVTIHIVDTTAPVITGSNSLNYELGTTITGAQVIIAANIVATDNSGDSITPMVDLSTVDFNTLGTYTATITATDTSGNQATYDLIIGIVNVIDILAPIIEITTDDLTYEVGTSLNEAQVIFDANITVTDNIDTIIAPYVDLSTVNTNQIGTYTVTVNAIDTANNQAIADTITIHIVDTTKPVITGATTLRYEVGTIVTAQELISDANIVVTDNSGENITPTTDLSTIDFNLVGTYTTTITAKDSSDNNAIPYNVTVEIYDGLAPTLTIRTSDVTYEIGITLTEAQIIIDANISAMASDGAETTLSVDLSTVETNEIGTYIAKVTATNTNNNQITEGNVTVHMVDTEIPVITGDSILNYEAGTSVTPTQFFEDANIQVIDNSGEIIIPTVVINSRINRMIAIDADSLDFDTIGSYVATISAEDISGNDAVVFNVDVEVTDSVSPVINIQNSEVTYEIKSQIIESQVIQDANITVTDNSGVEITPTLDLSTVNTNQLGAYNVTVTAVDTTNNQAVEATVIINIVDTIAPIINTTTDKLTYKVGTTLMDAKLIEDAGITVTDNSDEVIIPTIMMNEVNTNIIGTYTIDITANDSSNNIATAKSLTVEITALDTDNTETGNQQQNLVETGENIFISYLLGLLLILSSAVVLIVKRRINKS